MRPYRITLWLTALILGLVLTASSYATRDEVFDISKLPKPVQKTVKEQVADGKILKMCKETADRRVAYSVACSQGEKKWQIVVAPDGRLLLRAEEMNLTNLTVAAQKTIQQQTGAHGRIESIANVTEDGQSYYEAAITFNGQEKTFIVWADGKLLDTQIPENQARLPETQSQDPRNGEPKGGGYEQSQ